MTADSSSSSQASVVIIGRNEGDRLRRCLESLSGIAQTIIYVDSASSDGSVQLAKDHGAEVVELDPNRPFTAGRARNAGFRRLMELAPQTSLIQFVDGDCELANGWLGHASNILQSYADIAVVGGRRKERRPDHSIFNELCDIEWDTPIGYTEASGGDILARVEAFDSIGGFNETLIAGEDPELCYRLRKAGWKIYRADHPMTIHDAAMTRFGQWARRSARSGYAYAARAAIHWNDGSHYCWRENARILLWALIIPLAIIILSIAASPWFLMLVLLYAAQYLRIIRGTANSGRSRHLYACFVLLSKWTEFYGQLVFLARLVTRREQVIMEYK